MNVMKPSKEILEIAKKKAANLGTNQQIRVGGMEFEKSYWVFNFGGLLFIGKPNREEPLQKFFKNRPEYVMSDKNGVQQGLLQKLIS